MARSRDSCGVEMTMIAMGIGEIDEEFHRYAITNVKSRNGDKFWRQNDGDRDDKLTKLTKNFINAS